MLRHSSACPRGYANFHFRCGWQQLQPEIGDLIKAQDKLSFKPWGSFRVEEPKFLYSSSSFSCYTLLLLLKEVDFPSFLPFCWISAPHFRDNLSSKAVVTAGLIPYLSCGRKILQFADCLNHFPDSAFFFKHNKNSCTRISRGFICRSQLAVFFSLLSWANERSQIKTVFEINYVHS